MQPTRRTDAPQPSRTNSSTSTSTTASFSQQPSHHSHAYSHLQAQPVYSYAYSHLQAQPVYSYNYAQQPQQYAYQYQQPSSAQAIIQRPAPAPVVIPGYCKHSFKIIDSETTDLLWECEECASGPHWFIFECRSCRFKVCRVCCYNA